MSKLLLMSGILSLVLLPILAARERHPVRGLKKALALTLAYNAFYLFAVRVIYPRL